MTPAARRSTPVRAGAIVALTALAAACTDGATAPPPPAGLTVAGGDGQSAVVGSAVTVAPSIRVVDGRGQGVAGTPVVFVVVTGGGSVARDTAVSDASGRASAAAWTLGTVPGENVLRATAVGLTPVTLRAVATTGSAARLHARAGDGLVGLAGAATPVPPSVLVTDRFANPVSGAQVTFSVVGGGGAVSGGSVRTDDRGVATAGAWTLGAAGTNELQARVSGAEPVLFLATARTAAGSGGFTMDVRYLSSASARQRLAVTRAVARWQRVVVGDLPDVRLTSTNVCGRSGLSIDEVVDDLVVYVDFGDIDGPGKVLGQAGPCFIRSGSQLPVAGILVLDGADLDDMEADGSLDDVVLHEVGHILGVGTLWSTLGLISGSGGTDPYFTGAGARGAFGSLGGQAYSGFHVPVENTGGSGTRDGHWRESILGNELMTGFISAAGNPLSALTVASLADLGYTVAAGEADSFGSILSGSGFQAFGADAGRELVELPLPFAPVPVPPGG